MLRFDKYGSVIRKMHAFVPSVIGIGKVERHWKTKGNIHEYRDDTHSQGSFRRILKVTKTMESSEGKRTWFCGKSIKSFRHRIVSKHICVVKNSANSSCNITRMWEIRDCFKKIRYISLSINRSKPFKYKHWCILTWILALMLNVP